MVARFSKRGKNPGAIDSWLDSLGYFRKNVAYDETCLFRAVSEQLKYTQTHHEDIRKKCINYGKRCSKSFQNLVPKKREWCERLKKLSLHMLVCGDIEVHLICKTFSVDIVMFNGAKREMQEFKYDNVKNSEQILYICKTSEDHYDAVYSKEHIQDAGFCQSIVYTNLYEDVFGVPNVPETVQKMLHSKEKLVTYTVDTNHNVSDDTVGGEDDEDDEGVNESNMRLNLSVNHNLVAPFPFKVAKALDPDMYRNIEYDTWLEVRRELRLGDWYYGDDRLIHGTRCLVNSDGRDYLCYVQNILKDENKCEVYITELATRWLVNYSDLRPEDDASPWPLPYRFSKSAPVQVTTAASGSSDTDNKSLRKRREKKLSKMHDSNILNLSKDLSDMSVGDFEGYPLLMQSTTDASASSKNVTTSASVMECSTTTSPTTPGGIDLLQWQQQNSLGTRENCNNPISSSESPVFYTDSVSSPYYCNYNNEYSYPMMWQQGQYMLTPDSGLSDGEASYYMDYNRNPQKVVYYQQDAPYNTPTMPLQTPPPQSPKPYPPLSLSMNDKVVCGTPMIPTPQVNYYPAIMYPLTPSSAPICFSHTPPPIPAPRPETAVPPPTPTMPMYNSPLETLYLPSPSYINPAPYVSTPYLSPPPYVYPQSTPVTWYPSHVNSQGFVFPPPLNN